MIDFSRVYDFGPLGKYRAVSAEVPSIRDREDGRLGEIIFRRIDQWGELHMDVQTFLDWLNKQTVSITVNVNAQAALDAIAEVQAKLLLREGWHCISGKHLTIARYQHGRMVSVEWLRQSRSPLIERKTVDVDTYVALKKLRRAQEFARQDPQEVLRQMWATPLEPDAQRVPMRSLKPEFDPAYDYQRAYASVAFGAIEPPPPFPVEQSVAAQFVDEYERRATNRTYPDKIKIMERLLRKANADTLESRTLLAKPDHINITRNDIAAILKAGELK